MTDINHVDLIGRLVRDADGDFKYLPNGTALANVSLAVNRSKKNADGSWSDEVSYFDVAIWGKQAENLKPYLLKGKLVGVAGYLRQDRWEKDGQKKSRVTIVAKTVQLLGGGQSSQGGSDGSKPKFTPKPQQEAATEPLYPVDDDGFPEDIPF